MVLALVFPVGSFLLVLYLTEIPMTSSLDVVIPVYNEERDIQKCVASLSQFLTSTVLNPWTITIADNGSTDNTLEVARTLSREYLGIKVVHLDQKGRGRALKKVWLESDEDILIYMDVDLSTDLDAFVPLVNAIEHGADIAIGTRLAGGSYTKRSFKREFISRSYNALIKSMFFTGFSDAQCGFKAIRRSAARALLPHIVDTQWFFDTELLIIAEKRNFCVAEVRVRWIEDPDTRVKVLRTAIQDINGLLRLRFKGIPKVASLE
jgi:glycosyltransferase involved in cell wall biosynthesis